MKQPRSAKGILKHYREGIMTFRPTYKFITKTSDYDLARFPSYTDRILFEGIYDLPQKNPLTSIYYGCVDIELSDHKPIVGLFEAKIKVVDEGKKGELIAKLSEEYTDSEQDTESYRKKKFLGTLAEVGLDESPKLKPGMLIPSKA